MIGLDPSLGRFSSARELSLQCWHSSSPCDTCDTFCDFLERFTLPACPFNWYSVCDSLAKHAAMFLDLQFGKDP